MFRISVFFFAVSVAFMPVSCSSEEPPSAPPGEPRADAPRERKPESPEDMKMSSLQEQFDSLQSYADRNPRELQRILIQVDDFKAQAAGTKYLKKAEKLASDAQNRFRLDAEKLYLELRDKAEELMKSGKSLEALQVLGEYPAEFSSTEWQKKIDEMTGPVEKEVSADRSMDTLREQVKTELEKHNPEAALQQVVRYPEHMRTGKRKEEWDKMHSELTAKVEAIREQKRKEETLPWIELFSGANMDRWIPQSGEWELQLRDNCIVGKYSGESAGFMYSGTEESPWDNFLLEMEFKLVSGDVAVLGVRGKNEQGHSVFDQIEFHAENFPRGTFHEVTVEARGDVYTIREKGSSKVFTQNAEAGYTKGPICFFIPDGTELYIRKVRMKILK